MQLADLVRSDLQLDNRFCRLYYDIYPNIKFINMPRPALPANLADICPLSDSMRKTIYCLNCRTKWCHESFWSLS